jgi:hypothetical protein
MDRYEKYLRLCLDAGLAYAESEAIARDVAHPRLARLVNPSPTRESLHRAMGMRTRTRWVRYRGSYSGQCFLLPVTEAAGWNSNRKLFKWPVKKDRKA